jgi:hypothetical protein
LITGELPLDSVLLLDAARAESVYNRVCSDSVGTEDAPYIGTPMLAAETILGGVVLGAAEARAVTSDGPVGASGGSDCDTNPVGFVVRMGDQIGFRDELVIEVTG